jgi:BolA protein
MSLSRKTRLETLITAEFAPIMLEVINESHMHRVPPNAETHFKLLIVSQRFHGLGKVARQRLVYQHLNTELSSGLHALSLQTLSPDEWQQSPTRTASPACAHNT